MKVPKAEFIRFKKKFLELQDKLNLRCYKVYFDFMPLGNGHTLARIDSNQLSCTASVAFSSDLAKESFIVRPPPEESAAHEATHLLFSKLAYLAEQRFIVQEELNVEVERLARILEKIL